MWFWIAVTAFFLIVFLAARAVARGQGGIHNVGLQGGSSASDGFDVSGDAGTDWGDGV